MLIYQRVNFAKKSTHSKHDFHDGSSLRLGPTLEDSAEEFGRDRRDWFVKTTVEFELSFIMCIMYLCTMLLYNIIYRMIFTYIYIYDNIHIHKNYMHIYIYTHTTITKPMKGHCDMSSGSQCPAFNRSDLKHQT